MMQEILTRMARVGTGLMLALLACSVALAQDVRTNSMPGTNFIKYHTYKWVTVEGASYPNQIVDTQINTSIDSQLTAKELTKVDNDKAGLYVAYQASIVNGLDVGIRDLAGTCPAEESVVSLLAEA